MDPKNGSSIALGQVVVGVQKFGAYDGAVDTIDMGTLGLHLNIPLFGKSGRGQGTAIGFSLTNYSPYPGSFVIAPDGTVRPLNDGPGITMGMQSAGNISRTDSEHACPQPNSTYTYDIYMWRYTDSRANFHTYSGSTQDSYCNGVHTTTSLTQLAQDGSGYLLTANGSTATVTSPSGSVESFSQSGPPRSVQDANGNKISIGAPRTDGYGNIIYSVTDTLGSSIQLSGGGFTSPNYNSRNPLVITYFDDTGNQQSITLTYRMYTYLSISACSGTPVPNAGLVDRVTFPDGSFYAFTYENSPCASGAVTERIASVTLPSGGLITYTYPSGSTLFCDKTLPSLTRTTQDGATTYTRTVTATVNSCVPASSWTKVVKPNGDQTIAYFVVPNLKLADGSLQPESSTKTYETRRDEFSSSNTTTPIRSTMKCFNGATGDCTTTTVVDPVTQLVVTTTLDGPTSKVNTQYNLAGLATEVDDYDYGASAPTRKAITTYASLGNNISDRPASAIVYNSAGNVAKKTTYAYDETTPTPMTLPGHTTVTGARGNPTSVYRWLVSANQSFRTQNVFDDAGQLTSTTDPNGNVISYAYDSATDAFRTRVTRPTVNSVSHISNFTYGPNSGRLTSTADENSKVTSYIYDSMFRPSSVTYPDGGQTTYSYTATSRTTNKLLRSGTWITNTELTDGYGRINKTNLSTDPDGATFTAKTYDSLGRLAKDYNPTRCATPTTNCGESTWGYTSYAYDGLGRTTTVTAQDGQVTTISYSANCTTTTDPAGIARKTCFDAFGRLTQVFEDPGSSPHLNYETDYAYDALNNLLTANEKGGSTNSALWRTRTFTYDSLSRQTQAVNPESGTIAYTYDGNANPLTKTSPKPNQTGSAAIVATYTYDALNRLTQKSFNDGSTPTVKYGYDAFALAGCTNAPPTITITNGIGRRTAMCDAAGAESWSYDSMGRSLLDQRINVGSSNLNKGTTYTYNLDGSLNSVTYPYGRTIAYNYSGAARPVSAIDPANSLTLATAAMYAPQGALLRLQNDATYTYGSTFYYNNRLQPCRISVHHSGAAPTNCTDTTNVGDILDYNYNFVIGTTNNGNVGTITNNRTPTRSQTFRYDSINRLYTAQTTSTHATSAANCWAETYTYDSWGNLYAFGANTTTQSAYVGCAQESGLSATATANNQIAGNCYDAAGNLVLYATCPTGTLTPALTYDAENHLLTAGGVTYTYDGDGKRIKKSSGTLYWYGTGSDTLSETDLSGALKDDFIYFGGKRIARYYTPSAHLFYYFSDHLGSVRAIVQSGNSSLCYDADFYPFGGERSLTNSCTQWFKFNGKERDSESGLDNFLARYDSSAFGRFMSPDPAQWAGFEHKDDPQAWNGYAYGRNNPLLYTDPDGANYTICDANGKNCADLTDAQYKQFRQDNPNLRVTPSGNIYTINENGTETKTGSASYYNEKDVAAAQMLVTTGSTLSDPRTYALWYGASALGGLGLYGAGLYEGGVTVTAFDIGTEQILTNNVAGQIIGWGTGQGTAGVQATEQLAQNLTKEAVQEMIKKGLNRATVDSLKNMYARAAANAVKAAANPGQLPARIALMNKIIELWPK